MRLFRQFLVFQSFLLWQGGFLFYTAIVVPTGTRVLGSATAQGFITQQVTDWLNIVGLVWAGVLLWDLLAVGDCSRNRKRTRWAAWGLSVALLCGLFALHALMDRHLNPEEGLVSDRKDFRWLHIAYLWCSTIQWLLGLLLAGTTLQAWLAEARQTQS